MREREIAMKYGLQLYSVRDAAAESFEEMLRQVAEMGYELVESAGFFDHSPKEVKAMLDYYGLTLCSTHTGYRQVFRDFEDTLALHKELGCHDIVLPATMYATKEELEYSVSCINRYLPILESEGIRLHYHNHSEEFLPNKDGLIPWEELARRTRILFELDSFWAYDAGKDPLALMEKYKDRMTLIHLKDGIPAHKKGARAIDRSLGSGTAPVRAVHDRAKELGLTIVVESEGLDPTGPAEAKRCIDYLKTFEE